MNTQLLTEKVGSIQSALIHNDLNSEKVLSLGRSRFIRVIVDHIQSRNMKVRSGIFQMYNLLEPVLKRHISVNWNNIVSAVAHEMNGAISKDVRSVSSEWGPLNEYSEDRLLSKIKSETNRTLTVSEDQYLRFLVQRAISFGDENQQNTKSNDNGKCLCN